MRGWDIALLLAAATLFAPSAKAPARADDTGALTCDVHGRSFVLDDTDFAALAAAGLSRERFLSLALDSRDRRAVCDTRMLSRLINPARPTPAILTATTSSPGTLTSRSFARRSIP